MSAGGTSSGHYFKCSNNTAARAGHSEALGGTTRQAPIDATSELKAGLFTLSVAVDEHSAMGE